MGSLANRRVCGRLGACALDRAGGYTAPATLHHEIEPAGIYLAASHVSWVRRSLLKLVAATHGLDRYRLF